MKLRRDHQACGEVYMVRCSDDFVVGFQCQLDSVRFHTELQIRMGKFGLKRVSFPKHWETGPGRATATRKPISMESLRQAI